MRSREPRDVRDRIPSRRSGHDTEAHVRTTAHHPGPPRLQPMGRRRDPGRLRAALHGEACPALVGWRVAQTALGSVAFLALEAIGGTLILSSGFTNTLWAVLTVGLVIFLTGVPVSAYAARHGLDVDLLTRGAGFGYIGSTITSLIYASFTYLFFAIEAAILALALELGFGLPLAIGYLVSALAVIPLVTYGIALISRFQLVTQPVWLALNLLPVACIAAYAQAPLDAWMTHAGLAGERGQGFDLLLYGAACGILFALIAQIGEQVDFLRFVPRRSRAGAGAGGPPCWGRGRAGSCRAP